MATEKTTEQTTSLLDDLATRRRFRPAVARAIREGAGVTRVQLATELGVTEMTIYRWETGRRRPRTSELRRYAALLDQLSESSA